MTEIVEPTEERLQYISEHMRQWDRFECEAAGVSPAVAVSEGCKHTEAAVFMVKRMPVAVFGHKPASEGGGICWELGTDEIEKHRKAFYATSKKVIGDMLGKYEWLTNIVCMENIQSVRWLRRLGAVFLPETRIELLGKPFERFYLWR